MLKIATITKAIGGKSVLKPRFYSETNGDSKAAAIQWQYNDGKGKSKFLLTLFNKGLQAMFEEAGRPANFLSGIGNDLRINSYEKTDSETGTMYRVHQLVHKDDDTTLYRGVDDIFGELDEVDDASATVMITDVESVNTLLENFFADFTYDTRNVEEDATKLEAQINSATPPSEG